MHAPAAMIRGMGAPATAEDFPSGPWTGYYQQSGRRFPQDLELTFDVGVIRGGGWDNLGEFVIKGNYDLATREARWTKKYIGRHNVYYRGFREGKGIWGTWEIPPFSRGGFHIWPKRIGEGDTKAEASEQPAPFAETGEAFVPAVVSVPAK